MADHVHRNAQLVSIRDFSKLNETVIELQRLILAAQSDALAAQSDQFEMIERVRSLEEEIARLKAWDAEKENYRMVEVGPGAYAYVIKSEVQGTGPEYLICTTCYENSKKSVLQTVPTIGIRAGVQICPTCKTEVGVATNPGWKPSRDRRW
jgi:uncharacterized small protein (DUF1192 family)